MDSLATQVWSEVCVPAHVALRMLLTWAHESTKNAELACRSQ